MRWHDGAGCRCGSGYRAGWIWIRYDDEGCRWLLGRFAAAGVGVRVWDVTSNIGIAAFVCDIREMSDDPKLGMRRFRGAGCHPDRGIALSRALTEAAQTRLTYVVGARDDLPLSDYEVRGNMVVAEVVLDVLRAAGAPMKFQDVASAESEDIVGDTAWALERLRDAGAGQVVAVDLSRSHLAIMVTRVVIPGREGDFRNAEYVERTRVG